uniref:26S proteasome regulatory subunit 7 n=1 Tax=Magallana gigas TaxID=29159 RepID=A0A8W8K220_MAGGI
MPDHLGADQRKTKEDKDEDKPIQALDEGDIALLKTYGVGQYSKAIKSVEEDIQNGVKKVNELAGIKESDTGLAPPALWDLAADKQTLQNEQPLQVARCTKIINADSDDPKYIINVKQFAKFVVDLGDQVAPTDIEEGMRVGVDRNKYQIHIPLPPKIDPSVTMMQVEEKPDVTYSDVGGCKEQIEKLREVVETPLLHPERFVNLGIEPPKGVLLFGPPGTGKTLCARAVANRTDACFIRVIGSELVQKYVGEGARMVRELFEMARNKKACIIFFDEIDAVGGARFDDGAGGDNEVQRTMLELINQLDGFDPRGNIKVLMATNRPDTLDPALMRPGRLDRKIEFGLPDLEGRSHIFKIHARSMSVEKDIRYELLARLCPNSTGAEIRSVCTEAGMFAIRARRKMATEKDFLEAVNKVIKAYAKFNEQPLQVARCTKIINADSDDPKYIINVKQFAKFVVDLGDQVAPTDIEEGMRVGVDRNKYQIHIPLPPKIDPSVTMMQVEEKPDVTYSDVGGCKEQIEKLREVVETPLLHPERFVNLGIEPPKGVLLFGPPGTGKTLCARALANRTDACFIRVIQDQNWYKNMLARYETLKGARMVRELFEMARKKKACIIFFDEIDAVGGARFDDGAGGDNEVQRTMLELINQLDGFDPHGNIKVLMATNRPDTLDPALMRPGRLDRKIEFGLPDLEGRSHIFKIHARSMSVEKDIRYELLARLCPNSTGAEIRSVCTEAGMFAIRARRKMATEKDFLEAVNKVIKAYAKFSSTPRYMTYN